MVQVRPLTTQAVCRPVSRYKLSALDLTTCSPDSETPLVSRTRGVEEEERRCTPFPSFWPILIPEIRQIVALGDCGMLQGWMWTHRQPSAIDLHGRKGARTCISVQGDASLSPPHLWAPPSWFKSPQNINLLRLLLTWWHGEVASGWRAGTLSARP